MAVYYDQDKYNTLRKEYEFFRFQRYDYTFENGSLLAKFYFSLDDKYFFTPSFEIPSKRFYLWDRLSNNELELLVFNIGMIELISYWKLACPKKVYIAPYNLSEKQILWWKKLYFNGLGEFFYLNGIKENVDDITVEMSEWCELPCNSPIDSINGALIQARVMANDLNFTNVDSWTAWVGVNGIGIGADGKNYSDGLLVGNADLSEVIIPMRYYAVAHFSKFIPVGSRKVATEKDIYDYIEEKDAEGNIIEANYITNQVAYLTPDGEVVLVISNEGVDRKVKFKVDRDDMTVYTTTQGAQLEETYSGRRKQIKIPGNSITTIVFE